MPLTSTSSHPSLAAYRFKTELDLSPHIPAMRQALELFTTTYCDPKTGLVYHSPLDDTDAFPTDQEVHDEIPNSQGWYTAIEDCSFNGPLLLWAISRSTCGLDDNARQKIGNHLFAGLVRLWEVPGRDGFIARGVSPDSNAFYPNTTPDQIPNYLRGLWSWTRSGLSTDAQRKQAADIFQSVLGRLEAANWVLLRSDGKPGVGGSGNMTPFSPRGVAQFLAMFAMAGELTSQGKWFDLLRSFRDEANQVRLRLIEQDQCPTWLPWQMELVIEALRVLEELDKDAMAQTTYAVGIRRFGALASTYLAGFGRWSNASREQSMGMTLAQPARVSRRLPFRPGYEKSMELGLDLSARWAQVMQSRIIVEEVKKQHTFEHDGRACLVDHFWALSVICQSGMPWSNDGVRIQADTRDNWCDVAGDLFEMCVPDVPWSGTPAMVGAISASIRRCPEPR